MFRRSGSRFADKNMRKMKLGQGAVFDAPIANLKHKIDLALKSTIGGIVALAAALVALGFFCAALFMWLDERYGAIMAALVLGGAFTFVALVAVIVILILRRNSSRRLRRRARPPGGPIRRCSRRRST